jgi:hypothetical protein
MPATATAKSKLYIGGSTAADDLAEFEALTWTEIKNIEDLGEIGQEASQLMFRPVGDRATHLKGNVAGTLINLVVGRIADDAGQVALRTAAGVHSDYNFKVSLNNTPPTIFYFRGVVFPPKVQLGNAEGIVRDAFAIGINSDIIEDNGP